MANCPNCSTALEHDFGMVTCSGCQAVLMVNINGEVVRGETELMPEDSGWDQPDESSTPAAEFMPESSDVGWTEDLNPDDDQDSAEPPAEPSLGYQEDFFTRDNEDEPTSEPTGFPAPEVQAAQPDPRPVDVTSFANSEASNLESGELLYDLLISGLDSKELRDTFKAVIMDKKLKLNEVGLMKSIRGGKVKVPNLNPVKAKRIIEQLQFFDLRIQWKQKRLVMEDPEGAAQTLEDEVGHDL